MYTYIYIVDPPVHASFRGIHSTKGLQSSYAPHLGRAPVRLKCIAIHIHIYMCVYVGEPV